MNFWPFHRHREPEPTTEAQQARKIAQQGQVEARQALQADLARGPEINQVTDSLRRAHLRNHLSETMESLILRGHPR